MNIDTCPKTLFLSGLASLPCAVNDANLAVATVATKGDQRCMHAKKLCRLLLKACGDCEHTDAMRLVVVFKSTASNQLRRDFQATNRF